ncbi:hypothetical protein BC835DRAFT_1457646 [Cytidiella melzeri]|nr:hypothetical protein BC835DRAFT_1457646 [Cytidiella melzeri]
MQVVRSGGIDVRWPKRTIYNDRLYANLSLSQQSTTTVSRTMEVQTTFRILILLAECVAFYYAMSPPNPPSTKEEEDRYKVDHKQRDPGMYCHVLVLAAMWKVSVCMVSAFEILALLPSIFPSQLLIPASLQSPSFEAYNSPETIVGCVILLLGTFLRLHCYDRLARAFTFELTLRENHKLITDGAYSIVRHPSYTGIYGLFIGNLLINYGRGNSDWRVVMFLILGLIQLINISWSPFVMVKRSIAEDQVLKNHFGEEWVKWKEIVPYRLFPGVW